MLFKSAEIRWFATSPDYFQQLFRSVDPVGSGTQEAARTDYYLQTGLSNTNIKIREGQHEIKVKSAKDQIHSGGVIEQWMKWSTAEEDTILNTIPANLLDDWLPVKKQRWIKKFELRGKGQLRLISDEMVDQGVAIEYTRIDLPGIGQTRYSLSMEAFSSSDQSLENLHKGLDVIKLDVSKLQSYDSYGYAGFLRRL